MDLSLCSLHRQGLAGRPSGEGTPDLPFAGLQWRSGRFPALPYPPLEQMEVAPESIECGQGECFPFPFPWGSIDGERETAGDCRARVS